MDVLNMTAEEFLAAFTVGQLLAIYVVGNAIASFLIGVGRGIYRSVRDGGDDDRS
jgi:hypothetical protein